MPDPIQVERNFQQVMACFESTLSIRHRYRLFRGFVESLDYSFKKYESYIIQLLDELPVYSGPLSWSGLDPAEIEEDLYMFETINSALELPEKKENFRSINKNLQKVCLILYACLNETEKVDEYLEKVAGISFKNTNKGTDFNNAQYDTLGLLFEDLTEKLQAGFNFSKNARSLLKEFKQELELLFQPEDGSIFIPVAENYERSECGKNGYGRLREMAVDLYGETAPSTTDNLIWTTNIYGAETPFMRGNKALVAASRKLYTSFNSNKEKKFFRGGIRFKNSPALHDGNSANLAISVLWFTQLLRANEDREKYRVQSRAVITGDINKEGVVQEVDGKSINLKVKAAFFSWATVLVVPLSQRTVAEKELESLKEKYPAKRLFIIGVSHLREVFYDRRVAFYEVQGRVSYFFNRLKNEHSKFILLPSIVILLLIVARLAYGPIDHNPQNFSYEGSSLILENQNGAQVEKVEVGTQTASLYPHSRAIGRFPLAVISDLNGDGFNEVIYGKRNRSDDTREISDVTAYSVAGDSVLWEFPLLQNYKFSRQSAVEQHEMLIREMGLIQTDDGPKIVINANSPFYFQSIVYLLDAETGSVESEYLHIGRLIDMMLQDITGDGVDEVILSGINNAYWMASLVVLDVKNFHGYSPLTRDYKPADLPKAQELYYLLFPKTLLGSYTDPVMKYNEGQRVNFDPVNQTIRIRLEEGRVVFREEVGRAALLVTLSQGFKPVGVGTSDVYDIIARQLYKEGEIKEIPDYDYFQSYQDSIKYWNGSDFILTEEYFNDY